MNYLIKLVPLFLIMILSVNSYTQEILQKKITLECTDLPLTDIVDSIGAVSDVNFTYVIGVLPEYKKSINVEEKTLKEVLSILLKGTTAGYKIINEQIVFYDKVKASKSTRTLNISGSVKSKDKIPLSGAQITVIETQKHTLTGDDGLFNIEAPEGEIQIYIDRVGYKKITRKIKVDEDEDLILDIRLKPDNNLPEVVVVVDSPRDTLETIPPSITRYTINKLKQMPQVGGEADALQFIQLIPGIQSGNEGAGGIYVRGGSIDQNQIIMEGNTIYNPSHLFGFFSVFNSDAIRSIDLTKNAIPARYGERLSSVLDIKLKDPNTNQISGSGSIGTMLSKVFLELPINKKNTSLLIAARKSMTEFGFLTYKTFSKKNQDNLFNYGFFDYNIKLNHIDTVKRSKFYLHIFQAKDWLKLKDIESLFSPVSETPNSIDKLNWGNISESIGWSSNPNKRIASNFSINHSTYRFNLKEDFLDNYPIPPDDVKPVTTEVHKYNSSLSDLNFKFNIDLLKGNDINFKMGIVASQKLFRPGIKVSKIKNADTTITDTLFHNYRIETNEISTYAESNLKLWQRVHLNIGIRHSWFHTRDTSFLRFQPRLAMLVNVNKRISWNSSFSYITQFLHQLTNTGIGLPTDIWVPSIKGINPQQNLQYATGLNVQLKEDFNISLEGFYKRQHNLIAYNLGSKFVIDGKNWERNLLVGDGWAYGTEFFLENTTNRFTGWFGYTLSWSKRRFDLINNGVVFPFKFDRRHDVSLVGLFKVNNKVKLNFSWVFSSGNLTTIPTTLMTVTNPNNGQETDVYVYDEWNNYRMNSFHRLNIGVELYKRKTKFERIIKINLYNAYNRKNPFYVTIQNDPNSNNISFRQISLFPLIPSISYEFKF